MIAIYHNDALFRPNGAALDATQPEYRPVLSDLRLVALVDTDDLDEAYTSTNTIEQYWWLNSTVTRIFKQAGSRSTSCGDVAVMKDGRVFLCAMDGWAEITGMPDFDWLCQHMHDTIYWQSKGVSK